MAKKKVDLDALGVQYRDAKDSVPAHLRIQADAEIARTDWLKRHRGVPSDQLFDRATGDPLDPELKRLTAAISKAERDVAWCRALVVACGEAFKGVPFDEVPTGPRPTVSEMVGRADL